MTNGIQRILTLLLGSLPATCPIFGQVQGLDGLITQAQAEQSAGHYAEAAADYERATRLDSTIPELWANRGMMEFLVGNVDESVASLKDALLLNPKLLAPLLFLGKAYIQTGKPDLAIPYLNRAHALKPQDIEVLLSLGKADQALHQLRKAAAVYAEASRIAPDNSGAWFGLGVSVLGLIEADGRELAASQTQSLWARTLYADELFAQGRPVEALEYYGAAVAAASPDQKSMLARTMEQTLTHPDLFPLPSNSREALRRLQAQLVPQQGTKPPTSCPRTVENDPTSAGNKIRLNAEAACAYWVGDFDRSATLAGQALPKMPKAGNANHAEALYWSVKANERRAVAALSRFEELAPQSPATYDLVGDLYRHQRDPDSAMAEYKKALSLDPHDAAARLGTAVELLSLGNPEAASLVLQSALADRPQDIRLNLLMAESFVARQQYLEAGPYLDKCLTAPPEIMLRVHALLGRVDAEAGRPEQAVRHFELALSSDHDGSLHYQLSRLYRKLGNVAAAQKAEDLAKALSRQRVTNATIAVREATAQNP